MSISILEFSEKPAAEELAKGLIEQGKNISSVDIYKSSDKWFAVCCLSDKENEIGNGNSTKN